MLGLTLQLIEAGLAVTLVLNMADEARQLGIKINIAMLEHILGIPVVETTATTGEGVKKLIDRISHAHPTEWRQINYGAAIESSISVITKQLEKPGKVSRRTKALLLLQGNFQLADSSAGNPEALDKDVVRKVIHDYLSQLEH